MKDDINLCATVKRKPRRERIRSRCPIKRPMKYPPYGAETYEETLTDYHEWHDGICIHCQKTVAETYRRAPTTKFNLMTAAEIRASKL